VRIELHWGSELFQTAGERVNKVSTDFEHKKPYNDLDIILVADCPI
jgi:hypothetical protein